MPKNIVGEPFLDLENLGFRKIVWWIGGYDDFFIENIQYHSTENLCEEPLWVSGIFYYGKNSWIRGAGITNFSRNFLVSQCRKISSRNHFSFTNFWLGKKLWMRGGWLLRFSVEHSLSHSLKKLLRGPFSVWQIFGYRKIFCKKGVVIIYRDYFISHSTETVLGEAFSVSLISGIENFHAQEGYNTIFCPNFYVSEYRKIL